MAKSIYSSECTLYSEFLAYECNKYNPFSDDMYEGVSKSFRIGRLERQLQMVQLFASRCGFIAIL
jgi:hypothetical protein